ncbi:hypothetical protein HA052_18430 [Chromobacterium haemolyticum]|uniref:Uncharacterized protein n=1 Tax=Chromobacterium fluminis TaxID=3044269 RepID=A0ABX0LE12_9NEIS|nr:hypothetical protein [Chromobacterium haemolyticum]NHR07173.1 hypothetical protein [Chromobacterium haemolyticum]
MTPKPLPRPKPPEDWNARELQAPRQESSRIGASGQSRPPKHNPAAIHPPAKARGLAPPRRWSAEELGILQREYPQRGEACRSMLPGRGSLAINLQAHKMGLLPPMPAASPASPGKRS